MSRIVPKLNLNKTPQLVENNSLIMAKNIRLLEDGTIGADTSMEEVETKTGESLPYIVHHDAVIENVDVTKFSILAPTEALAYAKLGLAPSHPTSNNCFKFNITGNPYTSNNDVYCEKNTNIAINIKAFHVTNYNTIDTFVNTTCFYNTTDKIIDSGSKANTKVFLLAIYKQSYINGIGHSTIPSGMKEWYYIFTNKNNLNNQISLPDGLGNSYDYIVINPAYETIVTEENIITPAYDETLYSFDTIKYISQIVGLDNKIYFFKESSFIEYSAEAKSLILDKYDNEVFVGDVTPAGVTATFDVNNDGYVTHNGVLFEDSTIARLLIRNANDRIKIFEYDEVENSFSLVKCSWKYSGGKINGCVTVNGTGEYILTICEYDIPDNKLVPIKHINLARCSESDDETIYTQAPNIPISNLNLEGRYVKNIPAGVYQFFIRYKIHENFYTNWFPCSKELFAASHKTTDTLQGSLNFIDLHEDSNYSFIFTIQHLFPEFNINFEQYQLGFIISSEGGVFARSWKHFNINTSSDAIYFDYQQEDIEEINIDDLLKPTYEIFNVCNVAPYKNKLYIANYKETDFNEALQEYAENVGIKFNVYERTSSSSKYLNNLPLHFDSTNNLYDYFGDTHIKETYNNPTYCHKEYSNPIHVSNVVDTITGTYEGYNSDYNAYNNFYLLSKCDIKDLNNNNHTVYNYFEAATHIDGYNLNLSHLSDKAFELLKYVVEGLTANYNYRIDINNVKYDGNTVYIEYKYKTVNLISNTDVYNYTWEIITHTYTFETTLSFLTENITTKSTFEEANTLLPFTAYDFYIHYVKQNGIATNGYYIGTKEVKQFAKHYVQISSDDPGIPSRPDAITILPPIGNDLCFYENPLNDYAYEPVSNTYYHLEDVTTSSIIYPSFHHIECPPGYVGCFISIYKKGDDVAQCFNYKYDDDSVAGQATHKMDCMELDTLLYNVHENIIIKASNGDIVTNTAKYYSSNTTNPVRYLGCCGHIEFIEDTTQDEDYGEVQSTCWVIIHHDNNNLNKQLIKLTPYIKLVSDYATRAYSYSDWKDVNSPGYHCEIKKLDRDKCIAPNGYYVSGSDIYNRGGDDQGTPTGDPALILNDNFVNYIITNPIQILSNFNLNYLSLTNDLIPKIRTYQHEASTDGVTVPTDKQYITLVDSLLASLILELKSWFRDYTRKLFSVYDRNKFIEFNNTLRVSNVDIDEVYRYIYKFEATDYYNVPTQRGIITNVIAIANTVYVHCQHSLFKFSDNKTIQAQEEEVTLQENDIFNSGVSEVFDAQYGYAGLQNREQSLVTYNAYVFYDAVAKTIYAFGGEQQIGVLSDSIKKLINYLNPIDIRFVGDELNNRFYVNIKNEQGNVCLTFNFNSKSFVSIHDIDFTYGFHSRSHTYFVHEDVSETNNELQIIGWSIYRVIDKLTVPTEVDNNIDDCYIAYQNCFKQSLVNIPVTDNNQPSIFPTSENNPYNIAIAVVDIINNEHYELIKALNYISWICAEITSYGISNMLVAEESLNLYSGHRVKIYSDSCQTQYFNLIDDQGNVLIANDNDLTNRNSWQLPRYNLGVWSMNNFRNYEIPQTDVINLMRNTDRDGVMQVASLTAVARANHSKPLKDRTIIPKVTISARLSDNRQYYNQESSLIYGKYIVVRFLFFNKNFKLENLILNMTDYEKTK